MPFSPIFLPTIQVEILNLVGLHIASVVRGPEMDSWRALQSQGFVRGKIIRHSNFFWRDCFDTGLPPLNSLCIKIGLHIYLSFKTDLVCDKLVSRKEIWNLYGANCVCFLQFLERWFGAKYFLQEAIYKVPRELVVWAFQNNCDMRTHLCL